MTGLHESVEVSELGSWRSGEESQIMSMFVALADEMMVVSVISIVE